MRVVDCQAHWYPRGFFELCVGRTRFPRCLRDGDGYRFELAPEQFIPFSGPMIDLEQLFARMKGDGVEVLVSSSEPLSVSGWELGAARAAASVLNEEKARAQSDYPGRFFGLATLPMQNADAAVEELEHAISELHLAGVCIGSNVNGSPITAPELLPVYGRIEELGVPLFLHPTKTIAHERLTEYGLEYVIGYMLDTSVAALNLVFSGTVQRCPELTIVHPHLGAVLPYLAGRVDFEYTRPWAGNEELPAPPSEYLRRFYTDTVSNDPAALRLALDFYGVDHVLFGSDFPWWPPAMGIDLIEATLDDSQAGMVLGGNAGRMFAAD